MGGVVCGKQNLGGGGRRSRGVQGWRCTAHGEARATSWEPERRNVGLMGKRNGPLIDDDLRHFIYFLFVSWKRISKRSSLVRPRGESREGHGADMGRCSTPRPTQMRPLLGQGVCQSHPSSCLTEEGPESFQPTVAAPTFPL